MTDFDNTAHVADTVSPILESAAEDLRRDIAARATPTLSTAARIALTRPQWRKPVGTTATELEMGGLTQNRALTVWGNEVRRRLLRGEP